MVEGYYGGDYVWVYVVCKVVVVIVDGELKGSGLIECKYINFCIYVKFIFFDFVIFFFCVFGIVVFENEVVVFGLYYIFDFEVNWFFVVCKFDGWDLVVFVIFD